MNPGSEKQSETATLGVVIPAFNREDTIERAISSALGQSRPPDRVVVVDDGSTDGTRERAGWFGPEVLVIGQENSGVATARNRGVAALDSEWAAFLDSDDHWTDGHLQRMESAIRETGGKADLYFADADSADMPSDMTLWDMAGFSIDGEHRLFPDATELVMQPLHPFAIQASIVRRKRYLEVGGMWRRLRSREDTHLFFLLGLGGPFCAVAGVGVRITADDMSGGRLTQAAGDRTADYASCTVDLYGDLLQQFPDLGSAHMRELRSRLVDGYLAQASLALEERDLGGLRPLAAALRRDPRVTTRRGVGMVRKRGLGRI